MLDDWFLTAPERRNSDTALDLRQADRQAWTTGNLVTPLVHGKPYFRRLLDETRRLGPDDLLLFTDWRGDADQRLDTDPGTTVGELLGGAAERGVLVRGLVWRSHLAALSFSEKENRELAEDANTSGAHVVLDHRVRRSGSHHQKLVVIRRAGSPDDAVAFAGGIDLCYSRRDDADHDGDPQSQPMADAYGEHPPWHDIQCEVSGPAVGAAVPLDLRPGRPAAASAPLWGLVTEHPVTERLAGPSGSVVDTAIMGVRASASTPTVTWSDELLDE